MTARSHCSRLLAVIAAVAVTREAVVAAVGGRRISAHSEILGVETSDRTEGPVGGCAGQLRSLLQPVLPLLLLLLTSCLSYAASPLRVCLTDNSSSWSRTFSQHTHTQQVTHLLMLLYVCVVLQMGAYFTTEAAESVACCI